MFRRFVACFVKSSYKLLCARLSLGEILFLINDALNVLSISLAAHNFACKCQPATDHSCVDMGTKYSISPEMGNLACPVPKPVPVQ